VAYFDSYLEANRVFYEWLEENKWNNLCGTGFSSHVL
jgi:hypothetical protein